MGLKPFDGTKFFEVLIIGFIGIQILVWLLAQYTDIEFIKMGWVMFLFTIVILLVTLYSIGKRIGDLKKEDIIFIAFEFVAIVAVFLLLPTYIPEIFSSYSVEISEVIRGAVSSIISPQSYWGVV